MKYKYNNQWKEMNFKVSDTLPIGSIIEYDGESIPTGWEAASYLKTNYAECHYSSHEITGITPWQATTVDFSSSDFNTNSNSDFEFSGHGIKCKFNGTVLILKQITHNYEGELDIVDSYGWMTQFNKEGFSFVIENATSGELKELKFAGNTTSVNFYNARLMVIRIG